MGLVPETLLVVMLVWTRVVVCGRGTEEKEW